MGNNGVEHWSDMDFGPDGRLFGWTENGDSMLEVSLEDAGVIATFGGI